MGLVFVQKLGFFISDPLQAKQYSLILKLLSTVWLLINVMSP